MKEKTFNDKIKKIKNEIIKLKKRISKAESLLDKIIKQKEYRKMNIVQVEKVLSGVVDILCNHNSTGQMGLELKEIRNYLETCSVPTKEPIVEKTK